MTALTDVLGKRRLLAVSRDNLPTWQHNPNECVVHGDTCKYVT